LTSLDKITEGDKMNYDSILQWIEEQRSSTVAELIAWSAINSHSFHNEGLKKQREAIQTKLKQCGWQAEECPLPPRTIINDEGMQIKHGSEAALVLTMRPSAKKKVLLSGTWTPSFLKQVLFSQHALLMPIPSLDPALPI